MKQLITKRHIITIGGKDVDMGIRVGWRVKCANGGIMEAFWGSTKDEKSLQSLISDLRDNHHEEFTMEGAE